MALLKKFCATFLSAPRAMVGSSLSCPCLCLSCPKASAHPLAAVAANVDAGRARSFCRCLLTLSSWPRAQGATPLLDPSSMPEGLLQKGSMAPGSYTCHGDCQPCECRFVTQHDLMKRRPCCIQAALHVASIGGEISSTDCAAQNS